MIKPFILLLLAAGLLAGCKKDKGDSLPITKENLIGKYTLAAAEGSNQHLVDDLFTPCRKDDEYELLAGNLFKQFDMTIKCVPSTSGDGNWELAHDTITFDLFTGPIKKLTKNTLVITNTYLIGFEVVDVKFTFSRK